MGAKRKLRFYSTKFYAGINKQGPSINLQSKIKYRPIRRKRLRCSHCGHIWITRVEYPEKCPNCSRKLWYG